jgi:DNA-directed RNA polymerase subunit RPC12/RpoP
MARKRKSRRSYTESPLVVEPGIRCPHCRQEGHEHRVLNTYPNGNRRRKCQFCGRPFVSMRRFEAAAESNC